MKNNKAPGPDEITTKELKLVKEYFSQPLAETFDRALEKQGTVRTSSRGIC